MKITICPATALLKMIIHRNVAAYCRVSTQQEIQHHSLGNPMWEFVGIYADEVSGRHNSKMQDFQRMMEDYRAGKIDLNLSNPSAAWDGIHSSFYRPVMN